MKIYEVSYIELSYDKGLPEGTKVLGYYLNKATAERVAAENPATWLNRAATVREIEVNED